jgi:hypothetical protein
LKETQKKYVRGKDRKEPYNILNESYIFKLSSMITEVTEENIVIE